MLETNYVRFNLTRNLYSFKFLQNDSFGDLSPRERAEYNRQILLWESGNYETDEDLVALFEDAKWREMAYASAVDIVAGDCPDEDIKETVDLFSKENKQIYFVKALIEVSKTEDQWRMILGGFRFGTKSRR